MACQLSGIKTWSLMQQFRSTCDFYSFDRPLNGPAFVRNVVSRNCPLQVIDHYENPRNVGSMDKEDRNVGTGLVGAPACGDVMKLQVN